MAYYSFQSHFLVVKVQENNDIKGFSCTLFCPFGQNELDIKKCDAQILYISGNLRSPNKVRGSNRPKAVTEYTLIIKSLPQDKLTSYSAYRPPSEDTFLPENDIYPQEEHFH